MNAQKDVLVRHNVTVTGKGSTVMLFAHGLACDQNVWRFTTPAFEEDYKIVLFDHLGSGGSDVAAYDPQKYASLHGYAEDVLAICAALEVTKVIYVGHSVSSMIGLLAANKRPELFSCLIMIGPSPCYLNLPGYRGGFDREDVDELLAAMKQNYNAWAHWFAPTAMGNPNRPELAEGLGNAFCRSHPAITYEFAKVTFLSDNRSDLPEVKVPSLILQVSEDIVAPQHVGEYMHRQMPHSTLRIMKAKGHFPHLSAPDETLQLVKEYLQNTVKPAS